MSCILYYSNQCDKSKSILQALTRGSAHKDVHFLCIDKRIKVANNWYIALENGDKVILPPQIDRVPALLLMSQGHKVIFGDSILQYMQPRIVVANNAATQNNGEPFPFSTGTDFMGGFGVASDNFSFLDQSSDELSAKGSGGLRQLYNYATIDFHDKINTPTEDYTPDKVGAVSLEQLQQKRNSDIGTASNQQQFQQQQTQQRGFQQQQQQQQQQQHQFKQ